MKRSEFQALYSRNVERALRAAEARVGTTISNEYVVEFHGRNIDGKLLQPDEIVDLIYISEFQFFRIIDIAVKEIRRGKPLVFVRVSSHSPTAFEDTWNTPKGNGPFKVLESQRISSS